MPAKSSGVDQVLPVRRRAGLAVVVDDRFGPGQIAIGPDRPPERACRSMYCIYSERPGIMRMLSQLRAHWLLNSATFVLRIRPPDSSSDSASSRPCMQIAPDGGRFQRLHKPGRVADCEPRCPTTRFDTGPNGISRSGCFGDLFDSATENSRSASSSEMKSLLYTYPRLMRFSCSICQDQPLCHRVAGGVRLNRFARCDLQPPTTARSQNRVDL